MREKLISAFGGEKKSNLFRGITPSCRSVSPLVGVIEAEFRVERFDNLWSGDIRVEAPSVPYDYLRDVSDIGVAEIKMRQDEPPPMGPM